jgi:hypothetical protein
MPKNQSQGDAPLKAATAEPRASGKPKRLAAVMRRITRPRPIATAGSFLFAAFFVYWEAFTFRSFGPEFAYFFQLNHGITLGGVVAKYFQFGAGWYRPTEFYTPYWLLSKVISWHSITYWKMAAFATLLILCAALYRLARLAFPGERLGAFLALIYFVSHPAHYLVLFEISAFDFLHQILVVLTVYFFLVACRTDGRRSQLYNAVGAVCFLLALTAKEITFFTPVFLATACLVMIVLGDRKLRRDRLARYGRLLLPYAALLILYLTIHIARLPGGQSDGAYRTGVNVALILENARKFPLWVIRVFGNTGDTAYQANELAHPINDAVGYLLFVAVAAQWSVEVKSRRLRTPAVLMVAWTLLFLVLPSYSGAYLWHMSLSLAGYSLLLGVGLARLVKSAPAPVIRNALIILFVGGFMLLGKENLRATLHAGVHATAFRLNTENLLTSPPAPRSSVKDDEVIYVEDRLSLGAWNYGGGGLMRLAYLNNSIQSSIVRSIDDVPPDVALRWAQGKGARFFRYDEQFQWHDATKDFAARLPAQVTRYTNMLFTQGRGKDVPDLIRPLLPALADNGLAR